MPKRTPTSSESSTRKNTSGCVEGAETPSIYVITTGLMGLVWSVLVASFWTNLGVISW